MRFPEDGSHQLLELLACGGERADRRPFGEVRFLVEMLLGASAGEMHLEFVSFAHELRERRGDSAEPALVVKESFDLGHRCGLLPN